VSKSRRLVRPQRPPRGYIGPPPASRIIAPIAAEIGFNPRQAAGPGPCPAAGGNRRSGLALCRPGPHPSGWSPSSWSSSAASKPNCPPRSVRADSAGSSPDADAEVGALSALVGRAAGRRGVGVRPARPRSTGGRPWRNSKLPRRGDRWTGPTPATCPTCGPTDAAAGGSRTVELPARVWGTVASPGSVAYPNSCTPAIRHRGVHGPSPIDSASHPGGSR